MNHMTLIGRIVADPEIRYVQTANGSVAFGSYTIACDRTKRNDAEAVTDFIFCKVSGKTAEFAEKYLRKGMKIAIEGRLQVDNYTDKEGNKRSTTYVHVSQHEFCESKSSSNTSNTSNNGYITPNSTFPAIGDGFVNIADGVEDDNLPFN